MPRSVLARMLSNVNGEVEVGRVLLALAALAAILSPIGFQAAHMWNGGGFDVTAWCLAYPGGLATLVTAGILGIGQKDQNVETARATKVESQKGAPPPPDVILAPGETAQAEEK